MLCNQLHIETSHSKNQKKTLIVILITVIMMIVEISSGLIFGSIALLSDGIHMGTHTFALMITLIAYAIAKKNALNTHFTFGTGKVGVLGGYTSAVVLIIAALFMAAEAVERFFNPIDIEFNQSIMVAVIGLVVNIVSAFLLHDSHDHHDHHHDHAHHHDHNLKAAYLHVIADALTSLLAIVALLAGKYYNAIWLDPAVGIAGAFVVIKWGYGLMKTTGGLLLDYNDNGELFAFVKETVVKEGDFNITDLHIWEVASGKKSLICTISGAQTDDIKGRIRRSLNESHHFFHVTVEFI